MLGLRRYVLNGFREQLQAGLESSRNLSNAQDLVASLWLLELLPLQESYEGGEVCS